MFLINIPKIEEAEKVLASEYAKKIAREVSDKSITLVKNLDHILPLDKKVIKNILVYEIESGENAWDMAEKLEQRIN